MSTSLRTPLRLPLRPPLRTPLWLAASAVWLAGATPSHAAAPEWRLLRHTEVEATSFLQSNWNKYSENYHPNYAADDDPTTAWVEGVDGHGEGQVLRLPTSVIKEARAVRLRIRNGYQKSAGLLAANSAPRDVQVMVEAGGRTVAQAAATLERKMGWQEVVVPLPAGVGVSAVAVRVDSVHPGSKYKDTCISDVQVYVDTDVPYRAAIEAARLQRLQAWTAERRKTAAYFASLPATYPFVSTAFRSAPVSGGDRAAAEAELRALEVEADQAAQQGGWWSMTRKRGAVESPDQLWLLDAYVDLFQPSELGWFETDDRFAERKKESFDYGWTEHHRTHARVTFADAAQTVPQSIWFEVHTAGEERGPYRDTEQIFVKCDASGRPATVFIREKTTDELGDRTRLERLTVGWSADGRVERLDRVQRTWLEGVDTALAEQEYGMELFTQERYLPATGS